MGEGGYVLVINVLTWGNSANVGVKGKVGGAHRWANLKPTARYFSTLARTAGGLGF